MKSSGEYKALFAQNGIIISEEEIQEIVKNIKNIGKLLVKKYRITTHNYEDR